MRKKKRHTQTLELMRIDNDEEFVQLDKRLDKLSADLDRLKSVVDKIEDRVITSQESIKRMVRAEEELENIVRKTCNPDDKHKEE